MYRNVEFEYVFEIIDKNFKKNISMYFHTCYFSSMRCHLIFLINQNSSTVQHDYNRMLKPVQMNVISTGATNRFSTHYLYRIST